MEKFIEIGSKLLKYEEGIEDLKRRQSWYLGKGMMAEYWQLKGMIEAYEKIVSDLMPKCLKP